MRAVRTRRRTATSDIDEQTRLGEVYMRSLIRTQLRLGLLAAGAVLGLFGALPLLFLVGTAWLYVRQAEQVERDFTELVQRR
jgi:hypothetical protein